MLKLSKYYKPFILSIIIAIVLLFMQAMCDLKLPDYMSDIVNIGIQSNGIEQVTPKAISENGLKFMKRFMLNEDAQYVDKKFTKVSQGQIEYVEEYPVIENMSIYVLNDNLQKEDIERLNHIFAVSRQNNHKYND